MRWKKKLAIACIDDKKGYEMATKAGYYTI